MDTMTRPRVFITNYAGHPYNGAEKYGELISLTRGYVSFGSLDRLKYDLAKQIRQTHHEDWLLLSGVPVISALAAAMWFAMHGQVKMLVYDKKRSTHGRSVYRELVFSAENFDKMLQEIAAEEV